MQMCNTTKGLPTGTITTRTKIEGKLEGMGTKGLNQRGKRGKGRKARVKKRLTIPLLGTRTVKTTQSITQTI